MCSGERPSEGGLRGFIWPFLPLVVCGNFLEFPSPSVRMCTRCVSETSDNSDVPEVSGPVPSLPAILGVGLGEREGGFLPFFASPTLPRKKCLPLAHHCPPDPGNGHLLLPLQKFFLCQEAVSQPCVPESGQAWHRGSYSCCPSSSIRMHRQCSVTSSP